MQWGSLIFMVFIIHATLQYRTLLQSLLDMALSQIRYISIIIKLHQYLLVWFQSYVTLFCF